jgi:glycosyltransferase involved in cell wall biosynthesis
MGIFCKFMKKRKILFCGESSHLPTGFGNYTREVLSRLYLTNKYDIAELSCFRHPGIPKTEPWKIYPVTPAPDDPFKKTYDSQKGCSFGQILFELALLDFKPDIVIDVRDFWYFVYQENSCLRKFFHWIIAPAYDSSPQSINSLNMYRNADTLLFHSEWARNDMISKDFLKDINIGPVVSDAVDSKVFYPLNTNKSLLKTQNHINNKAFVIGTVMRNQRRKLIPDLFKILSQLIKKNQQKEILLYLNTTEPESSGWNIPALLLEFNVQNNVLLTYKCNNCNKFFPSVYKGINTQCYYCNNRSTIINTLNGISQEQLNTIYNLFDIYIQYAICEGFGIPQAEAASCGIPIITVNHGAMAEIGNKLNCSLVDIAKTFKETDVGSDRVYPDNDHCMDLLQSYIDMNKPDLYEKGKQTRSLLLENYSWDKTAKQFEFIIDGIELINDQGRWDAESTLLDKSLVTLPDIDNNREFIYYIVDNMICDPDLKKTAFIEEMIYHLDSGITLNHDIKVSYSRQLAIQNLQNYFNNKNGLEQMRLGKIPIFNKTSKFFNYS